MSKYATFSPAEFVDEGGAHEDAQTQQDYRAFQEWLNSQAPAPSASVPTPPPAPSTGNVATSGEPVVAEGPSGSSGSTGDAVVTSQSEEPGSTNPYLGSTFTPDPAAKCAICQKTTEHCYSICSLILFFCLVCM